MLRRLLLGAGVLILASVLFVYGAGRGWFGRHEGPGEVTQRPIPPAVVAERVAAQKAAAQAAGAQADKQILFGDLHVHTTLSNDAYMMSLPAMQGEGAHPQADACDFARYCSALDFWSINDHAESLTPERWRETVESIRQCNAVSGDSANPDAVAFLGWEWTQIGATPETHYGHKNVVLAHTDAEHIPARPIASRSMSSQAMQGPSVWGRGLLATFAGDRRVFDFMRHLSELQNVDACPDDVSSRELSPDCMESAATPNELYRKLDEWGHDALVIPHGTTWGFYTPPGSSWDKQLTAEQHDPDRQTLIEVYSGHGNSEEFRAWREIELGADGKATCPPPSKTYLPTCWRAGEIIRDRCLAAGLSKDACESRAAEARAHAAAAGVRAHATVPGVTMEEWLDAGQCRDCWQPAFNTRPQSSVQYIMALRNFDDPNDPKRFELGFIASSDNHKARPGTGYKEVDRREMSEAMGPRSPDALGPLAPVRGDPEPRSRAVSPTGPLGNNPWDAFEAERQASFFLTGGLVAVHSEGRGRDAIWNALERKEVYGTSGPRILLWFDLLNGPNGEVPMGGETELASAPTFRVRAVGSFEQKPGCPDYSTSSLDAERLAHLCRGECYNPSDERRRIARIEVVRIRPQDRPGEPVENLVEDPWRTLECPADPAGCTVTFDDPDFVTAGRDALYYVRAIEEPSQAVNAKNLRCEYDDAGNCVRVNPCFGDWRTDYQDDCLDETEERAWSSPIFVAAQ